MPSIILRRLAENLANYKVINRIEFLGTKVRAYMPEEYTLDIFYNETTGKYSYTVFKRGKRILGWDNAKHHINIQTYPHHYHSKNGKIKPSELIGDPIKDLIFIINVIEKELKL